MLNININILLSTGGSTKLFSVTAGSTYSNTGGSIHSVARIIVNGSDNRNTLDYDVAPVQVCIFFSVSI